MFSIDVETALGVRQGEGPITTAIEFGRRRALDQIGEASFRVPADDPRTALIGAGSYYHVYRWDPIGQTRLDLGTWKHRTSRIAQSGDATMLEVECDGLEIELVNENVYFNRNYSNTATNTIASALVALASGWSGGTISNPGNISVGFQGENILQALLALAETWRYHIRQGSTARTLDFDDFGADSGIRLIKPRAARVAIEDNDDVALITSVEVVEETERIINKVVPLGAGLGETQLNIYGATSILMPYVVQTGTNADGSSYYYLSDATSIATYGTVSTPLVFSDIRPLSNSDADVTNAKNALYLRAVSFLQARKDPLTVYGVSCTKLRGTLLPGDKVRLVYRGVVTREGTAYKWVDVDALQYVLAVEETYGEDGGEEFRLELSETGERVAGDGAIVAGLQHDVNVWKTHLQTYPCRSMDTRYEELDSTHDVDVPVDIDDAVLYLNSALLRIKTRPLRATATGAASGGGATSGASSTSTTVGGGAFEESSGASTASTTANSGSHRHLMFKDQQDIAEPVEYEYYGCRLDADGDYNIGVLIGVIEPLSGDNPLYTYDAAAAHSHGMEHTHTVEVDDHTHGMAHTHTVPAHTHDLDYGIYDDTKYPDTVRIAIDSVDRTAALGGPWGVGGGAINEELDITTYLVNAVGGLRSEHTVTISCDDGQGTVETVVKLMMTVPGIAVS